MGVGFQCPGHNFSLARKRAFCKGPYTNITLHYARASPRLRVVTLAKRNKAYISLRGLFGALKAHVTLGASTPVRVLLCGVRAVRVVGRPRSYSFRRLMESGPPHLGAELLAGFRAGRGGPQVRRALRLQEVEAGCHLVKTGTDDGVDFNVAQEAHDVEDAGETMLSFYDLDADRDYEANDVHVGQQALRVCTHMFALEARVLWPCLVGTVSSVCRISHVQALRARACTSAVARLHICEGPWQCQEHAALHFGSAEQLVVC